MLMAVLMTGGVVMAQSSGPTIGGSVYGGGALANTGNTQVNLTSGVIEGNVYGGGMGRMAVEAIGTEGEEGYVAAVAAVEATVGNTEVNLNGTVTQVDDDNGGTTDQYLDDCVVKGSIFGCNNINGTPTGNATVNIYKTKGYEGHYRTGKDEEDSDALEALLDNIDDSQHSYELLAVYGGGNLAAYVPTDEENSKATVNIYGCGLTSIQTVYGGGNAASAPATEVVINGTYEIEEVFGGGNGKDALPDGKPNPGANVGYKNYTVYEGEGVDAIASDDENYDTKEERTAEGSAIVYGSGAANVTIYGGRIHRVFGGSNTKGNVRITAVTLLDEEGSCEFCVDEAYGGGKSAPMDAEAKLLMACIPGLKEAYGGAQNAEIEGDVTLTITNGTFNRVFGGNDESGYIKGTITVNIEETGCKPIIIGALYGGGNEAPYTAPTGKHGPTLNVRSFTSIGDIYGGGLGADAEVTGDTYVNINVCEGRWHEGTYKYATTPSEISISDKIDELNAKGYHAPAFTSGIGVIHTVFGGGNAAPVTGNTNVNIGTTSEEVFLTPTKKNVQTAGSNTPDDTSDDAYEEQDTTDDDRTHTVKGANITGNVYGGGNTAEVTGDTHVVIGEKYETPSTPTPDPSPTPEP